MSSKKKNNHFVPRSYLRRFGFNDKQIGLFNIASQKEIERAPIKSQCSRDYFYSKDPSYEERFSVLEAEQNKLLSQIISSLTIPDPISSERLLLDTCLMFQAARTAAAVAHSNHLANEFGKAILGYHLRAQKNEELLKFLPQVEISIPNAVFDSIREHLVMAPLLSDMDCTLIVNRTSEEFITSDHPVAQCNILPSSSFPQRSIGFASRGLIVLYPISPRALMMWSDAEAYRVASNNGTLILQDRREVVNLNLPQFSIADENIYFRERKTVQDTIEAFRRGAALVRPPRPRLEDKLDSVDGSRQRRLLQVARTLPQFSRPRAVTVRRMALKGRFDVGDRRARDPMKTDLIMAATKELEQRQRAAGAEIKVARTQNPQV
jgi:Protein of unknown function (DUF4238)